MRVGVADLLNHVVPEIRQLNSLASAAIDGGSGHQNGRSANAK